MHRIRCHYDEMTQISQMFRQQQDAIKKVNKQLKSQKDVLQGGEWIGKGANKFYQEMDNEILPSMGRLEKALGEASQITRQINQVMEQAETESKSILKLVIEISV